MLKNLLRSLACVALITCSSGAIIADMICLVNKDCTSSSRRCSPTGGTCYYCDGMVAGDFCELQLSATCTYTGNAACGQRVQGSCNGTGTYGKCTGTTVVHPDCQVLKC